MDCRAAQAPAGSVAEAHLALGSAVVRLCSGQQRGHALQPGLCVRQLGLLGGQVGDAGLRLLQVGLGEGELGVPLGVALHLRLQLLPGLGRCLAGLGCCLHLGLSLSQLVRHLAQLVVRLGQLMTRLPRMLLGHLTGPASGLSARLSVSALTVSSLLLCMHAK